VNKDHQISEFYRDYYQNLMGTGLISKIWSRIHSRMESPFRGGYFPKILEVGAGNGEHIAFVSCKFDEYLATDLRIENLKNISSSLKNVNTEVQNIESLNLDSNHFDRVIVTCLLVHLEKPEVAIAELYRVVKKSNGFVTIYLPCEPGMFLRLVRSVSTHLKARRLGVKNIRELHFLEHRNYFLAIDSLVRVGFEGNVIKSRYYPFRFLSWNFNLYKIYQIKLNLG